MSLIVWVTIWLLKRTCHSAHRASQTENRPQKKNCWRMFDGAAWSIDSRLLLNYLKIELYLSIYYQTANFAGLPTRLQLRLGQVWVILLLFAPKVTTLSLFYKHLFFLRKKLSRTCCGKLLCSPSLSLLHPTRQQTNLQSVSHCFIIQPAFAATGWQPCDSEQITAGWCSGGAALHGMNCRMEGI